MVGTKVSIVTHKVQTTRTRIRGVSILGDSQIIFVDTPGLFRPRRRLDRAMVKAAWSGALDADIIVFLIEANRGITDGVRENLEKLKVKGPIVPIPVVCETNAVPHIKLAISMKMFARV